MANDNIIPFPIKSAGESGETFKLDPVHTMQFMPIGDSGKVEIDLLDEDLRTAARRLYNWQYENGDSFTCQLFSLIAKADPCNKAKLMQGFNDECLVFMLWQSSDPKFFFESFGIAFNK